jgi:hypothetical protein
MVVEMRNDLTKFLLLCAVFVLGFGASISALLFDDRRSSISSLAGALHATAQGLLGTQDMDQVTTQWEAEAVYTLYLIAAQVLLMNLLIAMFASTYERIKDHAADEWRLARAQIIMEYSHEVRGVLELPVLNLVGLALVPLCWLWRGLRRCSCLGRVTEESRVRLPWEEVGGGQGKEWGLPPPATTMHPKLPDSATQAKGKDEITLRRSLHNNSELVAGFSEATLHERWLEERADADPADFAELQSNVDSTANNRTNALEQRLMQQMQQMQQQAQEQQLAMDSKVTSLEENMREQQARLEEKIERQAEESNKRLDRLITLVSVMQAQ